MNPLETAFADWEDTPAYHLRIRDQFTESLSTVPALLEHRLWIEDNKFGFGERAFHWCWWLLVQSLPQRFRFLELGVYKGQSLSAVDLAAAIQGKEALVTGVSPLNGCGGYYEERDYSGDLERLFRTHNDNRQPTVIRRLSTDPAAVAEAAALAPFDAVYLDSDHSPATAAFELDHYTPLLRSGGYLICDDAGCNLNLPPGFFGGFAEYSNLLDSVLHPVTVNGGWVHVGSVVHLRIFKKT